MSRFLREVYLDIGEPGTTGKRYRGLRIRASIKMSSTSSPNEADIELYNPSADTISVAQREGVRFRLWAGYAASAALVFQGDLVPGGLKITPPGRDPTRVMRAELLDGGIAYRTTTASLSYSRGVSVKTVYRDIARSMGLDEGQVRLSDTVVLPGGFVFVGPAREALGRLAAISGAGWSIRDNALFVVATGEATTERAPLLSPATGLVGSPSLKDDGRVEAKCLLDPSLRPLRPFRLESERVTGDFVCEDVAYRIDSRGQEFYATVTGRPR